MGKTLSANRYADGDRLRTIRAFTGGEGGESGPAGDVILYTPPVVTTPKQIDGDIARLRGILRDQQARLTNREENLAVARARRRYEECEWRRRAGNGSCTLEEYREAEAEFLRLHNAQVARFRPAPDPTALLVIDEADRLKVTGLEQVRHIFDQGGIGVVLVGMPGIEKRLARYPQLYSRVGFVHEFRRLAEAEVRELLLGRGWLPEGVVIAEGGLGDEEGLAAILRVTGGNFRLLHRLLTQIARVLEINKLDRVTAQVVDAARESLVIGTA